jgi:hypothetical protein
MSSSFRLLFIFRIAQRHVDFVQTRADDGGRMAGQQDHVFNVMAPHFRSEE